MRMSLKHRTSPALRAQRGVGLIEVLVAVLVLAIGLLAVAGLQLRSLRDNESASERGVAVVQSHSILDAMRADRTNAINNVFNIDYDDATPTGTSFRDVAIAGWRANLVSALGADAKGSISCNGADCWIRVKWNDTRGTGGISGFVVETEAQL
jgi:type IV pilus assembly protein PilV